MADRQAYLAYLESDAWALQRKTALARGDSRCAECSATARLDVHHLTYARLGNEEPDDLKVLCRDCHSRWHRQENARRKWNARVDGWAAKVFGEGWETRMVFEDAEERFEQWLGDDDECGEENGGYNEPWYDEGGY